MKIPSGKNILTTVLAVLFNLLLALAGLEGIIAISLYSAPWHSLPEGYLAFLKKIYMQEARNIIQFDPACAQHDPLLGYLLKPGACFFSNAEFRIQVKVNQAGLRDDEESLQSPEIIVLGDSLAMGWGLGQEKTFPELIGRQTGLKVLNAAVSSYGTAREFLLLQRLDVSRLKYLILQYCSNDFEENASFVKGQGKLNVMGLRQFEERVHDHQIRKRYYLFKYCHLMIREILAGLERKDEAPSRIMPRKEAVLNEARYFVPVLDSIISRLPVQTKIVLFEVGEFGANDGYFIKTVQEMLNERLNSQEEKIIFLDFSDILKNPALFFGLDDHLNEKGHAALAQEISQTLIRDFAKAQA